MTVWRIKLNSGRPGVDWDDAKRYCRDRGVVGVGWGRPDCIADAAPLTEVLAAIEAVPDWLPTGPQIVRRLAETVAVGDLIWTRDRSGAYWLGEITGPWRYDGSDDANRHDLNNARPCSWLPRSFRDFEIPGSVVRNFAGTGQTLRRILNPAAVQVTEMLHAQASDPSAPRSVITPEAVLSGLFDPIDVEDVVLLMLQADGWLLMPSSRMNDTVLYEAALRRRDGTIAVVSVKSGTTATVPIPELAAAAGQASAVAYAFSSDGLYSAPCADHGVVEISPEQVLAFMAAEPQLCRHASHAGSPSIGANMCSLLFVDARSRHAARPASSRGQRREPADR